MPIPICFHYGGSVIQLYVRHGDTSRSSITVQDILVILGLLFSTVLFSDMNLSSVLSRSVKNHVGMF